MDEPRRNCNTCKSGFLSRCDTLKNNQEYQKIADDIHGMIARHTFKENFICGQYKNRYIEFPIEVSKITYDNERLGLRDSQIGKFARIAPCSEEHKGKTYLGLYLGDLPAGTRVSYNPENKELTTRFDTNPAIFVFDLNKIIFGYESWWGIVESEDDLREITQDTINDQWYMRALKAMKNPEGGPTDA